MKHIKTQQLSAHPEKSSSTQPVDVTCVVFTKLTTVVTMTADQI